VHFTGSVSSAIRRQRGLLVVRNAIKIVNRELRIANWKIDFRFAIRDPRFAIEI